LFGVDASQYAIELARTRVPRARLEVAPPGVFPFSGPFDVITAFDVLEHIESLNEIMSWIALNLTPSGGLVFVVPVYDGPTGPVIRALDKDPTHIHRESRDFWLKCARDRFEIVDWWGITRYLFPGGYYLHAVTHRWRRFTPAIACLLRHSRV
jgi:SAM-dependent methyltransferase